MSSAAVCKKRVAVASFEFEGNDFAPSVHGRELFAPYAYGADMLSAVQGSPVAVSGGIEVIVEHGFEPVPLLIAKGGSGGRVEPAFYREVTDAIVRLVAQSGPLDGVYLALHGAMATAGVPDPEGELLARIRAVVGPQVPVAASLDLHANLTPLMAQEATVLVGYENYPHDDAYTTGKRAAELLCRTIKGEIAPVMRIARLNMLVQIAGSCTREPEGPLARVKKRAREMEAAGLLSASYFTVQPWLDDDQALNTTLAIADGNAVLAQDAANQLADLMWRLRDDFDVPLYPVEDAVSHALRSSPRPVLLADTADCIGGGAEGDAVYVLSALLDGAPAAKSAVQIVDAEVAALAHRAGVGARIDTTVGFRRDPRYGAPIAVQADVLSLHDGQFSYAGGHLAGLGGSMGPTAVLRIGAVHVLVASIPTYEYGDEQFRACGMDPDTFDIVVLKNGMNFRNLVKPTTHWMLIDSVGSTSGNLASLAWQHRKQAFWPKDRDLSSWQSAQT